MKKSNGILIAVALILIISPVSWVFADTVQDSRSTESAIYTSASNNGFFDAIKRSFSKVKAVLNIGTREAVEDLSIVETSIPIVEQSVVDSEIKKFENEVQKADTTVRVQTTILESPVLNKIVPDRWVNEGITWKSIEEMDIRLAKLAEKSPTSAREYIEKNKLVGKHQLLRTPVTKITKKDVVVDISHFDYENSDKANYFGSYVDGSVVRTIFSEQFRGLGGQYKISEFSGYQFGNNVLITQMSGFEQTIDDLSEKSLGQLQTGQARKSIYKVLVLLVDYLDSDPPQQLTDAQIAHNILFNGDLRNFFYEQSYGKMNMVGDVYGWYTLQSNAEWASCNPLRNDDTEALSFNNQQLLDYMIADNIQINGYDHLLVIANCKNVTGGGFAGWTSAHSDQLTNEELIGSMTSLPAAIVKTSNGSANLHTIAHEIGHILLGAQNFIGNGGLPHANAKDCGNVAFASSGCTVIEYGNYYDAMGSWQAFSHHFRAGLKEYLGWIESSEILTIIENGTYTLSPLEGYSSGESLTIDTMYRMAKLKPPYMSYAPYILEYRQGVGFDSNLNNPGLISNTQGIFIYKNSGLGSNSEVSSILLDMNPLILPWEEDVKNVTLNVGQMYIDEPLGITLEVINSDPQNIFLKVIYAECERQTPSINSGGINMWAAQPGELYRYELNNTYRNNDNTPCGNSEFTINLTIDNPLTSIISTNYIPQFTLSANTGANSGNVFIIVPTGTLPGIYNAHITLINQNSGLSTTQTIPITVN